VRKIKEQERREEEGKRNPKLMIIAMIASSFILFTRNAIDSTFATVQTRRSSGLRFLLSLAGICHRVMMASLPVVSEPANHPRSSLSTYV
jgi:hypothetical protein